MFGDNKADRAFNITVMIMIILIKETMAYYNGEIRNNRLPDEDRVSELLSFA